MPKKVTLTHAEIEQDIITAIRKPQEESRDRSRRSSVICFVVGIVLVILLEIYFYPTATLWLILALFVFLIVHAVIKHFLTKYRIKRVSINDYQIQTDVVSHIFNEEYYVRGSKYSRGYWVRNYDIVFESGRTWHIPKEAYLWNDRHRSQALGFFNSAHRGDTFMVVVKKRYGRHRHGLPHGDF